MKELGYEIMNDGTRTWASVWDGGKLVTVVDVTLAYVDGRYYDAENVVCWDLVGRDCCKYCDGSDCDSDILQAAAEKGVSVWDVWQEMADYPNRWVCSGVCRV